MGIGAILMFLGDYLCAYQNAVPVFLVGDGMSAIGWVMLFAGFELN